MIIRILLPALFWAWCGAAMSGCSDRATGAQNLSERSFDFFMSGTSKEKLPHSRSLEIIQEQINGKTVPVSSVPGGLLAAFPGLSLIQPVTLNRDHRITGFQFVIQPLSESCTIHPAIVPDSSPTAFVYREPIRLQAGIWETVQVDCKDFFHISTRLGVDTDRFTPIHWNQALLFLVVTECDPEIQGMYWGPVTVIRKDRLYRFFRLSRSCMK